jgi:hypothetical protein
MRQRLKENPKFLTVCLMDRAKNWQCIYCIVLYKRLIKCTSSVIQLAIVRALWEISLEKTYETENAPYVIGNKQCPPEKLITSTLLIFWSFFFWTEFLKVRGWCQLGLLQMRRRDFKKSIMVKWSIFWWATLIANNQRWASTLANRSNAWHRSNIRAPPRPPP